MVRSLSTLWTVPGRHLSAVIAAIVIIPPKSDEEEDSPSGETEGEGGGGTDRKKGQDVAQVIKGSGPGAASTQGGGDKSKTGAGKKARKRIKVNMYTVMKCYVRQLEKGQCRVLHLSLS